MGKVIGYVGTQDLHSVTPDDAQALDVINIAFGNIVDDCVVWEAHDAEAQINRIRGINPQIKFLLSVGGWSSGGFSEAAMTTEGREKAAQSSAGLVQEYGLDGIDIDWEYPGTSVAGIGSSSGDKENFTLFLKAIREKLDSVSKDCMLTIAAGGDTYFTLLTDMRKAAEYLDYVQLMTYDLQGGFQKVTGHHTAVYSSGRNLSDACSDKAVRVFSQAGVPMEKLVLGVAFYSRAWQGVDNIRDGLGLEAQTVGTYGPDYGELTRDYINKNGYTRYWDEEAKAPYLFNGSEFISYDDEESIAEKIKYVKEKGLGGIMYWEYKCDSTGTLTQFMSRTLNQ